MVEIDVDAQSDGQFRVQVREGGSSTSHVVKVDVEGEPFDSTAAHDLVEASFRFLLDREPKESIMSRFGLSVISRYFPEYRSKIGEYLG